MKDRRARHTFVANQGAVFKVASPRELEKPWVLFLAHQDTLLKSVVRQQSLAFHVLMRQRIRNMGEPALTLEQVGAAFEQVKVLVLAPCRHSMHGNTDAYIAERRAVELAKAASAKLVIIVTDSECIVPPYLHELEYFPSLVATFGDNPSAERAYSGAATFFDLHDLDRPSGHSFHDSYARQIQFPHNVDRFGHSLRTLAATVR